MSILDDIEDLSLDKFEGFVKEFAKTEFKSKKDYQSRYDILKKNTN